MGWLVVGLVGWVIWSMWPFSTICTLSNSTEAQIIRFAIPLELFKMQVGRYPHGLDELLSPCKDCPVSPRWKGPYIREKLKDVWGSDLIYRSPGLHNKSSYDLSSPGPDGITDTSDDITNW